MSYLVGSYFMIALCTFKKGTGFLSPRRGRMLAGTSPAGAGARSLGSTHSPGILRDLQKPLGFVRLYGVDSICLEVVGAGGPSKLLGRPDWLAPAVCAVAWSPGSLRELGISQLSLPSPDLQSGHLPLLIKKMIQNLEIRLTSGQRVLSLS